MAAKPKAAPVAPTPPTLSGAEFKDVYNYVRGLEKFFKGLITYIQKLVENQQPTPVTLPVIRAGRGRIEHNAYESKAAISPPIEGDYAVVITEWRNERFDKMDRLYSLYIKEARPNYIVIGHDKWTFDQKDPPSYSWIAMKV